LSEIKKKKFHEILQNFKKTTIFLSPTFVPKLSKIHFL
jgi:hypothetical protein